MAFTVFTAGTTISATEFNDNFQHIGGGDWLPRGGSSLAATNGVYDIGSSAYRWNDIYANNINVSGSSNTSTWNLVSSVTLSATASSIEFTGLTNDIYSICLSMSISTTAGFTSYVCIVNGDSGTSYGRLVAVLTSSVYSADELSSWNYITLLQHNVLTSSTKSFCLNVIANIKTGTERIFLFESVSDAEYTPFRHGAGIWSNKTDTATTIKIYRLAGGTLSSGTSIKLWSPN